LNKYTFIDKIDKKKKGREYHASRYIYSCGFVFNTASLYTADCRILFYDYSPPEEAG
jgi:hypothetical protein